jgi:hypothetical protein
VKGPGSFELSPRFAAESDPEELPIGTRRRIADWTPRAGRPIAVPRSGSWSDRRIAEVCDVDRKTVRSSTSPGEDSPPEVTGKDGNEWWKSGKGDRRDIDAAAFARREPGLDPEVPAGRSGGWWQ